MAADRHATANSERRCACPASDSASIRSIWIELRRHLETRFREWCAELRGYPTPIARCDDQLPKLIEQRDHARAEMERMSVIAKTSSAVTADAAQRFLAAATRTDDDTETMLRSRLKAAASQED